MVISPEEYAAVLSTARQAIAPLQALRLKVLGVVAPPILPETPPALNPNEGIQQAMALMEQLRPAEAAEKLEETIDAWRYWIQHEPDFKRDLAGTLARLSWARLMTDEPEKATWAALEAAEIDIEQPVRTPKELASLASVLMGLGNPLNRIGEPLLALGIFSAVVFTCRKLVAVEPKRRNILAQNLHYLAEQYEKLGRLAEAVQAGEEEVQVRRVLKQGLADACLEQAMRLVKVGRVDAALAMGQAGLKYAAQASATPRLAEAALQVGEQLAGAGRVEQALPFGELALKLHRLMTPSGRVHRRADAHHRWGLALQQAGRHKEAATSFKAGAKLCRGLPGAEEALVECLGAAARALGHLDRHEEAEALRQEVLALTGEVFALPEGSDDVQPSDQFMALSALGMQQSIMGQHAEAAAHFAQAAAVLAADERPASRLERGRCLSRQAFALLMAGDRRQAFVVQQAAVDVLRALPDQPEAQRTLAEELVRLGHLADEAPEVARAAYAEAVQRHRALGEYSSLYVEALHQWALDRLSASSFAEARQGLEEALGLHSGCTPPPQVSLWALHVDAARACALGEDTDAALGHLDEGARLATQPVAQARVAFTRSEVLTELGRPDEARTAMLAAVALLWPAFQAKPGLIGLMRQLIEAALALCDPPSAELRAQAAAVGVEVAG